MAKYSQPSRIPHTAHWKAWAAAALAIGISCDALAGIGTDNSLGHPAQALTGPNYLIPETLGKLSGNNLFHSFQTFNILTGESANFTTATSGIANVISRVTGGGLSQINGLLSLTPCTGCGAPNFFFINPAGIAFGAGASIDVPGAFHVGTADAVKFPDGSFHAGLNQASTFSSAPPEAFGFLGTTRASVTINGGAALSTQPLQPMSVLGGDVEINNGSVSALDGGDIRVVALGQSAQEIGLAGVLPAADGNLSISNGGYIYSRTRSATDAGSIEVGAGNITIDRQGSTLFTGITNQANFGSTGNAGYVAVTAAGSLSIADGGVISSSAYSSGDAGYVSINAGSIAIDGQGNAGFTGIASNAHPGSTGNAGYVDVTAAEHLSIANGGDIASSTWSSGDAGSVSVNAGSIAIDGQGNAGFTGIESDANPGSTGNAGFVGVTAAGNLSIVNGGVIVSDTWSSGDAGSVWIDAGSIAIDSQGTSYFTGIASNAHTGSTGNAGYVDVTAAGSLSIVNGGAIASDTFAWGDAGSVSINAGSIVVDRQGGLWTGISSDVLAGSTGNAGFVFVTAAGSLAVVNGGEISSSTWSSGNAGSVSVNAGSIVVDKQGGLGTGIYSDANSGSTGNAGYVDVTAAGSLSIVNGGEIASNTFASGDAGYVSVNAGSLAIDGQGSGGFTGIASDANSGSTGNAGYVTVTAAGSLSIVNGGFISSDTRSSGNAGSVSINAGSLAIDGQGSGYFTGIASSADYGSTGNAGYVDVTAAGSLSIVNGGFISSNTRSSGNAGYVSVNAGSIVVDKQGGLGTGIYSEALIGSLGSAGFVTVTASENLSIVNGGEIASNTFASGDAGYVSVNAGSLAIDGQGSLGFTGIRSNANTGSTGNAGYVDVTASENLSIINGGFISSDTRSSGNAGSVSINAGSLAIDGQGSGYFTGIASDASAGSTGNAGVVDVTAAGSLSIVNGGVISSNTRSSGNAGSVSINAGSIVVDKQGSAGFTGIASNANPGSSGNAGFVAVTTLGNLSIANGGEIGSNTFAWGDAGYVSVNAGSLTIDGQGSGYFTGIASSADPNSTGNAGYVTVTAAGSLAVVNGGEISSNTWSSGSAGYVDVSASTLLVNGASSSINASANANSSGQTGSVIVTASGGITLSNGGELAIRNDATVADPTILTPTLLSASAPDIILKDAKITAASTGNVSASDIEVRFSNQLFIDPSVISTSANLGNGGSITIQGGNLINLINSQITTSVLGLAGNGGNINIGAGALVMNTGFIQANTAAMNALGGTVGINVQMLVPSGSTLFAGGQTPYTFQLGIFGYNVIQAAAPTGLSGTIQITAPVLDVSGSLGGLYAQVIDSGGLSRSPCQATGGSSLAQSGRGGLPPSARGLLRAEPVLPPTKNNHHAGAGVDYMRVALSNWECS